MSFWGTNRRTKKKFRKVARSKKKRVAGPLKDESPMENEGVF